MYKLVGAKLWWIVGCSLSAILPASAPSAQESSPPRTSPEEVNAPWDDLISVLRKSPTREDQRNRASQGTNQRDESLAREAPRELQPNAVPDDHEEPDRSGALPPVSTAPTSRPTRQGLGEEKASGQPASATRPRYETTGRMPKSENHRGRERQVSSSASSGGAAVESTPSSRRKSNRQNGPEFSSTVIPEFPRSLLPTSVTR